ncbi:unnamed protein product, partial [Rotaria sordida]
MMHSDGIPLYKSKNCNVWPILGAVLELPPYSRTRTDNTLLLSFWIGKQKPNFNIIFEKLSKSISHLKNGETFITRENLLKINLKFRSISFIHDILRRPRSFSNVEKWKASEVRLFILYIGLPVLAEFLPEERIEDFALYNVILRLLHDYWDNDKKLGDSIS